MTKASGVGERRIMIKCNGITMMMMMTMMTMTMTMTMMMMMMDDE